MAKVWIVGAGYVGAPLALGLHDAGHEVIAIRRNPPRNDRQRLHWVGLDASSPNAFNRDDLFAPDWVVHAIPARTPDGDQDPYLRGLDELLTGCGTPSRFVHVSSTGVYTQTDGSWVDESSPVGGSPRADRLARVEQNVLARLPTGQSTIVRFSGIYGPGRTRMLDRARSGELDAGNPHNSPWTNRIHRDDCVGVLRHLLETRGDVPEIVLASDNEPATWHEVVSWLQEFTQAHGDNVDGDKPERNGPPEYRRGASKRCRADRLRSLGYRFKYPTFRDGYAALLENLS